VEQLLRAHAVFAHAGARAQVAERVEAVLGVELQPALVIRGGHRLGPAGDLVVDPRGQVAGAVDRDGDIAPGVHLGDALVDIRTAGAGLVGGNRRVRLAGGVAIAPGVVVIAPPQRAIGMAVGVKVLERAARSSSISPPELAISPKTLTGHY